MTVELKFEVVENCVGNLELRSVVLIVWSCGGLCWECGIQASFDGSPAVMHGIARSFEVVDSCVWMLEQCTVLMGMWSCGTLCWTLKHGMTYGDPVVCD